MPGLPASLARQVRAALRPLMANVYTRTPVVAGVQDAHFNETSVLGDPVPDQPCAYLVQDRLVVDEGGRRTVSTPTLYVYDTDPLSVGDLVSNITDREGTVLLVGPLAVETIDPAAEAGASTMRIATLRQADPVRSD